jgi:hypothetical protein
MRVKLRFIARAWYYFRIGYSTYLTFLLGYLSTLVTVYYLAVKNIPQLISLFPHFVPFAVLATIIGGPLSVAIGWVHLKRSLAFSSEQDISVEANPYSYKLTPGYSKEVYAPIILEQLMLIKRIAESQGQLDMETKARLEHLERQMKHLMDGGIVGNPRGKV